MHAYGLCWIGLGGGEKAPLVTISPLIEEREQFDEDGRPSADYDAGSASRADADLVNLESTTGLFYIPFVITQHTRDILETNFTRCKIGEEHLSSC